MKNSLLLAWIAVAGLVCPLHLSARTWTEAASGRTLEGEFVKVVGSTVLVRRDNNTTVNLPLEKLSQEDQAFVKEQSAPKPAPVPEEGVTLSGVHLCCAGCERGVERALAAVEGLELAIDRSGGTVTLKSPSPEAMRLALDSLASGGYYGASSSPAYEMPPIPESSAKADSLEVSGVHLCCGACVRAVEKALAEVDGYAGHNAGKDSPSFTVTGKNLTAPAVLTALRKHGFSGTIQ